MDTTSLTDHSVLIWRGWGALHHHDNYENRVSGGAMPLGSKGNLDVPLLTQSSMLPHPSLPPPLPSLTHSVISTKCVVDNTSHTLNLPLPGLQLATWQLEEGRARGAGTWEGGGAGMTMEEGHVRGHVRGHSPSWRSRRCGKLCSCTRRTPSTECLMPNCSKSSRMRLNLDSTVRSFSYMGSFVPNV